LKVKKTTEQHKDRETNFRELINQSPDGMVVLDTCGEVKFSNPIASESIANKFPGIDVSSFDIDALDHHCVLKPKEASPGRAIPCSISKIDWQGETYTLAVIRQGTDEDCQVQHNALIETLDEGQAPYRELFQHAFNGFVLAKVVADSEGSPIDFIFADVNQAFEKTLNLRREQILGKSARLFLPNIETMAVWRALQDVAQSRRATHVKTYSNIYDKHFKLSIYTPTEGYVGVIFNDITQQVQAEDELRQNEAKFRSLFDAMALGVVIQDRNGVITSANPAAERILGQPHKNLIGIGSLNYDWQTVKLNGEPLSGDNHPAIVALRTGRKINDFILGLHQPSKKTRKWLSVSAAPEFRDGEEEAFQVITTFTDITDRIRVQRAFEERVKELRCLTVISSMLQKKPSLAEVCDITVLELISAMRYPQSAFAEIQLAGEERTTNEDGLPGVNRLTVPIHSSEGMIGYIGVSYTQDLPFCIPEEKDLLESIADSLSLWYERTTIRQRLEESEARFRQAVMTMPAPIMIHAEDGEVITLNDAWVKASGYSHAEIPTLSEWLEKAYGDKEDNTRLVIEKLFALEEPLDEGEFTIRTNSGEQRIWDFRSTPLGRLPDGRKTVISMANDVTQRKQVERERELYYERILALRQVDKQISASLDMEEVLGRVTGELSRVMQYDSM
jgi:PAS domain S-box-containing protein